VLKLKDDFYLDFPCIATSVFVFKVVGDSVHTRAQYVVFEFEGDKERSENMPKHRRNTYILY
jgi:hypothetical protein